MARLKSASYLKAFSRQYVADVLPIGGYKMAEATAARFSTATVELPAESLRRAGLYSGNHAGRR
jgi:hypothetical protein